MPCLATCCAVVVSQVKPGMPYLDVIRRLKESTPLPISAYHVSGEYAMMKAAVERGWLDERAAVLEVRWRCDIVHDVVGCGSRRYEAACDAMPHAIPDSRLSQVFPGIRESCPTKLIFPPRLQRHRLPNRFARATFFFRHTASHPFCSCFLCVSFRPNYFRP